MKNKTVGYTFLPLCPFDEFLGLQDKLCKLRCNKEVPQLLIFSTHYPCFSLGQRERKCPDKNFRVAIENNGSGMSCNSIPIVKTSHGGAVTYHSPGILGCYTIFSHLPLDTDDYYSLYFRSVSRMAEKLGLLFHNMGKHDIWIENRKIGSVGIYRGLKDRMVKFGFNVNVCGNLAPFDYIYPCGNKTDNLSVTSIEKELGYFVEPLEIAKLITSEIKTQLYNFEFNEIDPEELKKAVL